MEIINSRSGADDSGTRRRLADAREASVLEAECQAELESGTFNDDCIEWATARAQEADRVLQEAADAAAEAERVAAEAEAELAAAEEGLTTAHTAPVETSGPSIEEKLEEYNA